MRLSLRTPLSSLAIVCCLAVAVPAAAQISDADKEAARALYIQGFELQQAGNYADALDRFRRSAQVYAAPTTLLHVAECEARVGHLVEAAETYRTLTRIQLPAGANPQFAAAQTQGAAELQQVEPRIPHVRVEVSPPNTPNLVVFIDEQAMNMALLGVDRPINPGEHKFTAQAPGFARTEILVKVEEKQPTRLVSLPLSRAVAGVAPLPYYPQQAPPVVYVPPTPYPQAYPPPVVQGGYGVAPPVQPVPVTPGEEPSRKGIFFGPRVGYDYPVLSGSLGDAISGGFSLGIEADFRFARRLYVGVVLDHGFLGESSSQSNADAASGTSASFSTTNFDAVFGVLTNPDKFGGIFQFMLGYRTLSGSLTEGGIVGITPGSTFSASQSGPEAGLGAGFWIPIGSHFRLAPRLDATFGSLSGNGSSTQYANFNFVVAAYPNFNFH